MTKFAEIFDKELSNLQERGILEVSPDGNVTITDKGRRWVEENAKHFEDSPEYRAIITEIDRLLSLSDEELDEKIRKKLK